MTNPIRERTKYYIQLTLMTLCFFSALVLVWLLLLGIVLLDFGSVLACVFFLVAGAVAEPSTGGKDGKRAS